MTTEKTPSTFQVRLLKPIFIPPEAPDHPGIYIPAMVVGDVTRLTTSGIRVVWEFAFVDSKLSTNYPFHVTPDMIELLGVK